MNKISSTQLLIVVDALLQVTLEQMVLFLIILHDKWFFTIFMLKVTVGITCFGKPKTQLLHELIITSSWDDRAAFDHSTMINRYTNHTPPWASFIRLVVYTSYVVIKTSVYKAKLKHLMDKKVQQSIVTLAWLSSGVPYICSRRQIFTAQWGTMSSWLNIHWLLRKTSSKA